MNREQDFETLWAIKNAEKIINAHAMVQKFKYTVGADISGMLEQTTSVITQAAAIFKVFKRRDPFLTGALIGSGLTALFFLALGGPENEPPRTKVRGFSCKVREPAFIPGLKSWVF